MVEVLAGTERKSFAPEEVSAMVSATENNEDSKLRTLLFILVSPLKFRSLVLLLDSQKDEGNRRNVLG